MAAEPRTREQPSRPPSRPPRRDRPAPGWTTVALGVAAGFLVGVVFAVGLGAAAGDRPAPPRTMTVAAAAPAPSGDETVITRTAVPDLVGERLDVAKAWVQRGGFIVAERGGGLFGAIVDSNWEVAAQEPPPGTLLERGSTVRLTLRRR